MSGMFPFQCFFGGRLGEHLQIRIVSILWFPLTVSLHISDKQSILSSIYDKTGTLKYTPILSKASRSGFNFTKTINVIFTLWACKTQSCHYGSGLF